MRSHIFRQTRFSWQALCLVLAAWALLHVDLAQAQPVRTLVIRDGKVTLDGRLLAAEEIPASLAGSSVDVQLQFSGAGEPVLALGGHLYRVADDRLEELSTPLRAALAPPVESRAAALRGFSATRDEGADVLTFAPPAPHSTIAEAGQELLEEQALALNQIVRDMQAQGSIAFPGPSPGATSFDFAPSITLFSAEEPGPFERAIFTERLRYQADRVNQLAQELPRIEFRTYLNELQRDDAALYEKLVREQRLEEESYRLAYTIRALPAGPERQTRKAELRDKLEQIFALKQENRHQEIVQLEEKLAELQARLDERKRLHDQIIENRLQELVGAEAATEDH